MKTFRCPRYVSLGAVLLLLVSPGALSAQPVVAPPPASLRSTSALAPENPAVPASSFASALRSAGPLVQAGPIGVRPHLQYRAIYGDGIEAGPGNPLDTYIQSVSPGLLLELGQYWRLDYTPTWTYYSNPAFRDTFEQAATLTGRARLRLGTLGGGQTYESSYAMLAETGRQTHQEKYATFLEGTAQLGQHTYVDASVNRSVRYANAVTDAPEWTTSDWRQWSSTNWLRYEVSPRLELSGGLGLGYAVVGHGADMSFILPQARVAWKPVGKISLTAQFGQETRRFETGDRPQLRSPVYTAAAEYQLLPTTKFSLEATRAVSASYFANQITKSQGWGFGFEQRLLRALYLQMSVTEQSTHYLASRNSATVQRDDDYRAFSARLTTVLLHRITAALLYQSGRNSSNEAAYAFHSNQYGVEIGVRF